MAGSLVCMYRLLSWRARLGGPFHKFRSLEHFVWSATHSRHHPFPSINLDQAAPIVSYDPLHLNKTMHCALSLDWNGLPRPLFGQCDHVRRYGPDVVERLRASGFSSLSVGRRR